MKAGSLIGLFALSLALIILNPASASAQIPGSSPSSAVSRGIRLDGIIECGEGYTSHELYDLNMTLVEVIRGEEAWKRIQEADKSNRPAGPDKDFLLARVRLEYHARGTPGLCVHSVVPQQFTAYSPNGEDYAPSQVAPPKPELRKEMKSGDSLEGWVAFIVAKSDKAPLMFYTADPGGAVQHGEGKWFLLK